MFRTMVTALALAGVLGVLGAQSASASDVLPENAVSVSASVKAPAYKIVKHKGKKSKKVNVCGFRSVAVNVPVPVPAADDPRGLEFMVYAIKGASYLGNDADDYSALLPHAEVITVPTRVTGTVYVCSSSRGKSLTLAGRWGVTQYRGEDNGNGTVTFSTGDMAGYDSGSLQVKVSIR